MNSSLIDFKELIVQSLERTDTVMPLVPQQRDHAKARYRESRDDITLIRSQMQEWTIL